MRSKTWSYHGEQVPRRDVIRYHGLAVASDMMIGGFIISCIGVVIAAASTSMHWAPFIGMGLMVLSVLILMITQR